MNRFLRFSAVGTIGFMIDAGILQTLVITTQVGPYVARIASFLAAASGTWFLNRRYTFAVVHKPTHTEWLSYVAFMVLGALVNYGAFALCISYWPLAHTQLWLGVAVGSVAGLGVNFTTSRLVFLSDNSHR